MRLDLNNKALKAAALMAPKKDVRYYLKGVNVRNDSDLLTYTATDGRALVSIKEPIEGIKHEVTDFNIIIPLDVVKKIPLKWKIVELELINESAKQWRLGDLLFCPVDGRYPDFERVFPEE